MKSAVLAVGTFAISALAQGLPACGTTCIDNMLALGPSLGCPQSPPDASCLCSNVNFAYGIRDCSNAVCGPEVASTVIAYGSAYCSSATASGTVSASTASGADIATSTHSTLDYTPTGTVTSDKAGVSSAIATSPIVSVVTKGSSTFTTTVGYTTISGVGTESGSAASGVTSVTTSSVATNGTSTVTASNGEKSSGSSGVSVTAKSSTSTLETKASSGASSVTGTASSSTSKGAAPKQTAAHGMMAAVGLAALLL